MAETAFNSDERHLLGAIRPDLHQEWLLRSWCAKEAVGKALGYGLVEGPCSAVVVGLDVEREQIAVQLAGQLAERFPDLARTSLAVQSIRTDDLIAATTLCQAVESAAQRQPSQPRGRATRHLTTRE